MFQVGQTVKFKYGVTSIAELSMSTARRIVKTPIVRVEMDRVWFKEGTVRFWLYSKNLELTTKCCF